ncbi:MAG: glycosyltransferase family 4 protein [Geminicoccaceae bacterium]
MARKKVIFLASFLNVAGAQEAAFRVARGLGERGYDTEVWFLYAEAKPAEMASNTRILLDVTRPSALQYLQIAVRLFKALRKAKPAALVSFLPLANVLGQSMALLAGVPRRIASHRAPRWTVSSAMRHADSVVGALGVYSAAIAVTRMVKQSYDKEVARYKRRIDVVYNGLDWLPSARTREQTREKFGLPKDRFIAVTLGRLKPVKNYPFLVEVAGGLDQGMIVAAGDGPLFHEIDALIERTGARDRMRLLGAVAKSDVADLYRAADCFLLASSFEGQSNALLEAMHDGRPVIVSDKPEQRETVVSSDGELAGIALGLDDAGVWSQTIEDLARDPVRCAALGAAAKRRAEDFTLDRQLAGFADVIEGQPPADVADLAGATAA